MTRFLAGREQFRLDVPDSRRTAPDAGDPREGQRRRRSRSCAMNTRPSACTISYWMSVPEP